MVAKATKQGRFSAEGSGLWTKEEHQRFLDALQVHPNGPWKLVAELVGTRSVRQTMTHAQKQKQKQARHARGLHLRQKRSPDAESPDPTSNATAKKRSRKRTQRTTIPPLGGDAGLEPSVVPLPPPCHDGGTFVANAGTASVPPVSRPVLPYAMSEPPAIKLFQDEVSSPATVALDELLCVVGSTQILWPEPSVVSAFDTHMHVDPVPFKPELWTPADDVGVFEFLASSIL